ncbi:MAG: 4Fe-4S binding protein [Cyclobacteriaceae bacterium]
MKGYFNHMKVAISSMSQGLKLTFRYLFEARNSRKPIGIADESYFEVDSGIVTLQYPHETFPVPETGRYQLHNEIDDCIVCDKCAKVCPVDCIDIEAIKAPEVFGETSDGTPKRIHAAKFDIDMSKCCFCGLCTTVCPTECLTMTDEYDFSEFDVKDHIFSFAEMSLSDIAQKRKDLEEHEAKKALMKEAAAKEKAALPKVGTKPAMKPKVAGAKPTMKPKVAGAKPSMKPNMGATKPAMKPKVEGEEQVVNPKIAPKPVIKPKPVMKPKIVAKDDDEVQKKESTTDSGESSKPKPKFRPRPMIPKKNKPKDGND